MSPPPYAELFCRSNFSFLEGASAPEDLVRAAVEKGLTALAITDRDGVYGLVRAWKEARSVGLSLVSGALLTVRGRPPVVVLVRTREGWANLCRLLTEGRRGQPKGHARHEPEAVLSHAGGLAALLVGPWKVEDAHPFREAFGAHLSLGVSVDGLCSDDAHVARQVRTAVRVGVPAIVTGNVLMHRPEQRRLHDVLTCIRRHTTVERAGRALLPNAERVIRGPAEMEARFARWRDLLPGALERTAEAAVACTFTLQELDYVYPREVVPDGFTPMGWLRELCRRGLVDRYPAGAPPRVRGQVERELRIIEQLGFPAYFLTVYDLVAFARDRGILCQGRGSAANSAVCYVLGITSVDPDRSELLFERFISPERNEPPDIDVDFEHERREEVIQYAYARYGRDRAAMVNEVISWRSRMAIRDVGKALGLSLEQVNQLTGLVDHWGRDPITEASLRAAGLDPTDRRVRLTLELVEEIRGFPRHVSIHVGGLVLTDDPLVGRVPVEPAAMEGRTVIQWDKDDIDAVGFVKVDLLSLGMLTAIRKCFDLVAGWAPGGQVPGGGEDASSSDRARAFTTPAPGAREAASASEGGGPAAPPPHGRRWTLATVPPEDPSVYDMICRGDTMGVFQIESRAQMSMLPRLRPRCFYDLVVEVSIVRPGPIQGGMVHPFLNRRLGREPVTYPHPSLEPVLARTLGIPIFQEQVMAMAVAIAGFTPGEADQLRRAMGAWRRKGTLGPIATRLREGMLRNGIDGAYAEQIVQQIQGFGEYGFPESHAASFALLVYVSAWLKRHYPAAFTAALINSQPMGFYSPASLLADARRHGVQVLPVDVQASGWDCRLEDPPPPGPADPDPPVRGPALRLGYRMVQRVGEEAGRRVEAARKEGRFRDLADFVARTGLPRAVLGVLARADALRGLGMSRREALWCVEGLYDTPLFSGLERQDRDVPLPRSSEVDDLRSDFRATGVSLRNHPVGIIRARLRERGVRTVDEVRGRPSGEEIRVAGVVTCRQRPGTARGVLFLSLEDETGILNVVVWPRLFARHRSLLLTADLLEVCGRLQRQDEAVSVLAGSFAPLPFAPQVEVPSRDFR